MLRHKKKHDSGVSSNGEGSDDDSISNHSSSAGSRTPDPEHHHLPQSSPPTFPALPPSQAPAQIFDQKKANLMEKISRLRAGPDGQ